MIDLDRFSNNNNTSTHTHTLSLSRESSESSERSVGPVEQIQTWKQNHGTSLQTIEIESFFFLNAWKNFVAENEFEKQLHPATECLN